MSSTGRLPLVSIVVPVYNGEKYIEDCLLSILRQNYPSMQIIVVDDGSTDGTAELVLAMGSSITYVHQENSGSAVARNVGVELSKGEFVAFVDSDDLWAPNRLRQQVDFLHGQRLYHAACGRFMPVHSDFSISDASVQICNGDAILDNQNSGWMYLRILETSIYHIDTLMVRRNLMKSIRFNPSYRSGQDFDFFLQLSHATPIAQLNSLYAFYRRNPQSVTHKPHSRNYRAEIICAAIDKYGRRDQLGREVSVKHVERLLARSWFTHGYGLYRARWYRMSAKSFLQSLKYVPTKLAAYRYLALAWLRRWQDATPAGPSIL